MSVAHAWTPEQASLLGVGLANVLAITLYCAGVDDAKGLLGAGVDDAKGCRE
jgi:hypothetical protein